MQSQPQKNKGSKGSVQFKNTKGRLQIVFSYPVEIDGEIQRKRFYISTGYEDTPTNRYRVGDVVRQLQRDIDYGEVDLSLRKYKPTSSLTTVSPLSPNSPNHSGETAYNLAELWEKYSQFKQPQVSPSTFAKDFSKHRNHISRLPSTSLEDAIAIRDHLLSTLTPNAAKRCLTQFKACCNWAIEEGLIDDNPFASMRIKIPKGRSDDRDINPFTKDERDSIIQAFATNLHYSHYTNYVRFLFSTGARPNEVIGLQWKHITANTIRFEQGVVISENGLVVKEGLKTQTKRNFPITPDVKDILDSVKQLDPPNSPDDFVFRSPKGKFIDQHNFANRAWKSILENCQIPYRKPYQTRHTFISLCVESHVNSTAIARWTGTSSNMIDKHYGATNFTNLMPPDLS